MRKYGRTDSSQTEIVDALRAIGASVLVMSSLGNGAPDILCGRAGKNYLLELKRPDGPPSGRKLTKQEKEFHAKWAGQICVVSTPREALQFVGAYLDAN